MTRLYVVPLELREANEIVTRLHRHHTPPLGHRFSLGAIDGDGTVRGAAICGHPVARLVSMRDVVEVTRLCTDGTPNACSILYAAAARAAAAMGYTKIQTYILAEETGTSLRASGWTLEGVTAASEGWDRENRTSKTPKHLTGPKGRWVKQLCTRPALARFMPEVEDARDAPLFDLDFGVTA